MQEQPRTIAWTRRDGDEQTTLAEFRRALADADEDTKARLLGKIMREARDEHVWRFTTVSEVRALFPKIETKNKSTGETQGGKVSPVQQEIRGWRG